MDLGKIAKQVLGTIAPTVLTAIGGPFGALAAGVLKTALGTSDDSAVDTALSAADPATLLKVKQAELDLQAKLAELGIAKDKLSYDDLSNARAMQVATKDPTPRRLAWLIVAGFLGMVFFEAIAMIAFPAQWNALPRDAAALLGMAFGYLANEAKQVGSFYFGSSADSESKTQTLSEIAKS